jgi:hypothetical protein
MLVEHFRQRGDVGIGCWPDSPLAGMLPPDPDYDGRTLSFPRRSQEVEFASFLATLPPGYQLLPRDAALFKRSFDYDDTVATF